MCSNCLTCIYWANSKKPNDKKMADCDLPFTISGENLCKNGSGKGVDIETFAHDDSGLQVYFMTGENFGCVNHRPKKTN